ncbi:hypothetical protein GE061_008351 [Apolygus lucorum]|uniref:Carboxylic ester hydrolase n=1 Tax=Apolygus lucorum TaxID=248454 RepID=A0A6A4J4E3_APOLU|nr:hypothetical protein GE061_008351 [Apolygus lucorum]
MELRTLLLLGVSLVHSSVIQPHDVLAPSAPSIVVNTPLGTVSGWERVSRDGRPYLAWTRIPFAQPPVGKLRFMITLDKAPVLVYVHGGAFKGGYGGAPGNADYIMDEDVILVSIQYRVNGFGFMTLGDKIMPGNYGLKDQAMALKWVKQNIASFGGNPNSITVFGESAGGACTHYLLKSPVCDDIVTRAVSDSGTINHIWSLGKVDFERQSTMAVVNEVGCTSEDHSEILTCLQGIPASQLMSAIQNHYPEDSSRLTFVPVIEPEDAEDAFMTEDLSLRPSTKPWITSTTNGEYELFAMCINIICPDIAVPLVTNVVDCPQARFGSLHPGPSQTFQNFAAQSYRPQHQASQKEPLLTNSKRTTELLR